MNLRLFITLALILGVLVIVTEVTLLILGITKPKGAETIETFAPLPASLNTEVLTRISDREKYLLMNKEQFIGIQQTPTPTP